MCINGVRWHGQTHDMKEKEKERVGCLRTRERRGQARRCLADSLYTAAGWINTRGRSVTSRIILEATLFYFKKPRRIPEMAAAFFEEGLLTLAETAATVPDDGIIASPIFFAFLSATAFSCGALSRGIFTESPPDLTS